MEFDLDPLDDLLSDGAVKNARAGAKFQPKAKARPRKASSVSVHSSQPSQTASITEHTLTETIRTEEPSGKNEGYFCKSDNDNSNSVLVNSSQEHVASRESVGPLLGLDSDAILRDSCGHGNSCLGKSEEENVGIYLDDFHSQSTTLGVNTSSRSPHEVDINAELENGIPTSSPASTEECNTVQAELPATADPLTLGEATISANDGDFYVKNRQFGTEEPEAFPFLDTLDIMSEPTTSSGLRTLKFQPVPKVQVHKEKKSAVKTNVKSTKSVSWADDAQGTTISQTEYMTEEGSVPLFSPSEDVFDFSPMGFSDYMPTDPTSEHLVNEEEPTNLKEIPHSEMTEVEADTSMEHRRKSINECRLVDESEDEEVPNDGELPADCLGGLNEDNNDVENRAENESPNKRARRKSKKPVAEKEKPVRKRKKANEASDQSKKAPKKFSHSTRRNRRQVDKTLLETPEDEINFQKLPLRDLIIFAEYKERSKKKEATTSETPATNKSTTAANSSAHHYSEEEAAFGWDQEGREYDDEQENPNAEESSTYFNYQSHMEKTRAVRWSKQDTELFYEAIRQFGTDLSMIQQLFPDRTRRQVKLKYKKEERQHPLRLHEALLNRATDHSHFELVIERLKKIAAEEKQNAVGEGSDGLIGEEEAEEVAPQTYGQEELAKKENLEEGGREVQDFEGADVPEVQSPIKSFDDDEDESSRWNNYAF
ncbi:hypothetical protein LguiB_028518 [Lonicera macranthoides]